MVTLDELAAFVAIADTGSMSAAAEKLHITQPAMTRRLKRLESDLGAALLDRRTKPIRLTTAGREVLERARQVLQSVELVYAASHELANAEFRVGLALTVGSGALARPIDRARTQFPKVAFQVTTAWSPSLLGRLKAGALESGLLALPEPTTLPGGVSGELLREYPLVCVAPRRAGLPAMVDVRDLAGAQWVLNPEGCALRPMLRHTLDAGGVGLRVSMEVVGWDLQLSLVARGAGFGLVPAPFVRDHPLRERLQVFRLSGHTFRLGFWFAWRNDLGSLRPIAEALKRDFSTVVRGRRHDSAPPHPASAAEAGVPSGAML
jgi:DNA-binding transcriptional LysR family regulator